MATVEALRAEIQQTLKDAETRFFDFQVNANTQLAALEQRADVADGTQDEAKDWKSRMDNYDTASTEFANQMKQIQAEQTQGLADMRSGLDKIFSQSGAFATLSNLVEYHAKTLKELEEKLKPSSAFTTGDRRTPYSRSIFDFKALSDIKMLDHGGGFLTWPILSGTFLSNLTEHLGHFLTFLKNLLWNRWNKR